MNLLLSSGNDPCGDSEFCSNPSAVKLLSEKLLSASPTLRAVEQYALSPKEAKKASGEDSVLVNLCFKSFNHSCSLAAARTFWISRRACETAMRNDTTELRGAKLLFVAPEGDPNLEQDQRACKTGAVGWKAPLRELYFLYKNRQGRVRRKK